MNNIAVITARSGSKGLKDKNIKLLNHKPLIAYTIEAALQSSIFDVVMVSTDSQAYADIAKNYGASVPFLRSDELANDNANSYDVLRDVLKKYKELGQTFDTVTLLQPTSPLRTAQHIIEGFSLYTQKKAKSVIGVCEVDHSPLWSSTIDSSLSLNNFISSEVLATRRQQLPTYYRINGALYIMDVALLDGKLDLYNKDSYAYIMNPQNSIDIDTILDFQLVETIINSQ